MSVGRLRAEGYNPLEYIEKLINRSSLSTKRVTHTNIITLGDNVLGELNDERDILQQKELRKAVAETEARGTREMNAALQRLQQHLTEAKLKALEAQKNHYLKKAERVADQRDRLEEERLRELKKKLDKEKSDSLAEQWREAEKQKELAVKQACEQLTQELRKKFALEKELAISDALKHARAQFTKRLEQTIAETEKRCQKIAAEEAERVAQLNADEIKRHNIRYLLLKNKYDAEHAHRLRVESDFAELQTDYQRFMNYTDGKYHSDYMMKLRKHGLFYANKQLSNVSEYIEPTLQDLSIDER